MANVWQHLPRNGDAQLHHKQLEIEKEERSEPDARGFHSWGGLTLTLSLTLLLRLSLKFPLQLIMTFRKRRQNVWPRTGCLPLAFLVLLCPLSTPLSMWQTISTTTTITGKYCAKYARQYVCTYLCFSRNNNNNDNNNNQVNTNIANSANMQISIGKHPRIILIWRRPRSIVAMIY